ncbi:hypothetical protein [Urechidicola vernalis]|uniref:DUF4890 domain-containing protein n=1 Tax=Urechidicola vernalis TaxID=3075600 RepID=A0ABU2Y116_9FLAO|nr:hypothetical protein [Urechidicola sp. P050]MDT0551840.1 hypothetical protein [Urechidicola sp. P050]
MKKITLVLVFFAFAISGTAQSKNNYYEGRFERAKVFAKVAAEEFDLTEKQEKEVYELKVAHFEEQSAANKKYKKGEITEEEKKAPNRKFGQEFKKYHGKNYQELQPFYDKVKKEMKKLN